MSPRLAKATVMVAASLALACGGDDEEAAEPPAPIPRAYTAKIDKVCKDMREEIRDMGRRPSRTEDKTGFLRYSADADATIFNGIEVMRSVPLPRGPAGQRAKRAIDETEKRVEELSNVVTEEMLTAVSEGRGDADEAVRRYSEALSPELHAPLREVIGARSCTFDSPPDKGAPKKPVEPTPFE